MFEQSIYEVNEPAPPQEAGDFLYRYEVKPWDWSPRFFKLAGAVAVVNILLLVGVAQTSLFTTKGCDSPFVGKVCSVLDIVYAGSLLFGSDREMVDKAYDRIELGNGDYDVTMIDVGGENAPLDYPQGYFQIANPEEYQAMLDAQNAPADTGMFAPGIPNSTNIFPRPSTGGDLTSTRPNYAKPNKNPVIGELPNFDDDKTTAKNDKPGKDGKKTADGDIPGIPGSKIPAEAPKDPNDPANDPALNGQINRAPFKDLAKLVNGFTDEKRSSILSSQFIVEASGKLTKDGRFEKNSFRLTRTESSDKDAVAVLKRAVEAFNESGFLSYLSQLTGKTLSLRMTQDANDLGARVVSQLESASTAEGLAAILRIGADRERKKKEAQVAQMQSVNDPANAEKLQDVLDDLTLLNATTIGNEGANLVIQLKVPKSEIQAIVERKLAKERATAPQNDKVNLSTGKRPGADNAG